MSATSPHTLIISDLHLQVGRPDITEQFLDFLRRRARFAQRLLILGDLFEVWVGDDAAGPFEQRIASALADTAAAGVDIGFLAGNRDFLLGDDYCRSAGMARLVEPVRIELAGASCLLLHGDVLCTDDTAYQRFRARVRDPEWQRRQLARPAWLRRGLARTYRWVSGLKTRRADPAIMDVNDRAVIDLFERSGVDRIIHGHTHRPGVHDARIGGRHVQRMVLGDWFDHGSVIEVTNGSIELVEMPRH
ncbi:UDP-2,3-diacylglucosamine diphosphatase [Halomonas denitrificans]|nr:UDP-2,3-diacylglucosamine diphosphatase [Halomonas denitrificans]